MANINKIRLSGVTYDIGGGVPESTFIAYTASTDSRISQDEEVTAAGLNALNDKIDNIDTSSTVELTQAEYDALVTAGTVSADTYYVITDAQAGDLTNYYTKTETNTLLGGKADTATTYTKTEVDTALASKQTTLTAGTGIDITDNVISATGGGGGKAIEAGRGITVTTGATADTISVSLPIWTNTANNSVKECDSRNNANFYYSHAEGTQTEARYGAHSEGASTKALGYYSHSEGLGTIANNMSEHASGQYNVSTTSSTDADKTLFSVGNGTAESARHNAFEIRQNGDIYCSDGTNDVKLQDTITATAANTTALGGLSLVKLTQAEYDALATKDNSTLYVIVN